VRHRVNQHLRTRGGGRIDLHIPFLVGNLRDDGPMSVEYRCHHKGDGPQGKAAACDWERVWDSEDDLRIWILMNIKILTGDVAGNIGDCGL
jgi:hypothetical protein